MVVVLLVALKVLGGATPKEIQGLTFLRCVSSGRSVLSRFGLGLPSLSCRFGILWDLLHPFQFWGFGAGVQAFGSG